MSSLRLFTRTLIKPSRSSLTTPSLRPLSTTLACRKQDSKMSSEPPKHEMVYFPNLASEVRAFKKFRKVLHTGLFSQLVAMEIPVGGNIGDEVHTVDQVLMFTSGEGKATIAGKDQNVKASDVVVVPAGTQHEFINTSKTEPLELVTIYSPAEHDNKTVHETKEQGDEEEEKGNDEAPEWSQQSKQYNQKHGLVKESGGPYDNGDDGRHQKS